MSTTAKEQIRVAAEQSGWTGPFDYRTTTTDGDAFKRGGVAVVVHYTGSGQVRNGKADDSGHLTAVTRLFDGDRQYYQKMAVVLAWLTGQDPDEPTRPEHPTRPGHTYAPVLDRVDEPGEPIMRCTHPDHTLVADANACAFDAMWATLTDKPADEPTAHRQAVAVATGGPLRVPPRPINPAHIIEWVTYLSSGGCTEGYVRNRVVLSTELPALTTTNRPVLVDMVGQWQSAWGGYVVEVSRIRPTADHAGEWERRWVFTENLHA
ncbi:MAG TPA: hypothetical protein VGL46_13185 [Pseudonocardiaceae bacterium]|jgi:hypothetical protein